MSCTTVVHISCIIDFKNISAKLDHSSRGPQIVKDKDEKRKYKVYTLPLDRQEALRKYLARGK